MPLYKTFFLRGRKVIFDKITFSVNNFHVALLDELLVGRSNGRTACVKFDGQHSFAGQFILFNMLVRLDDFKELLPNLIV